MQPSQQLLHDVRASFIRQGTSLKRFCRENNIESSNIYRYLRGDHTGEKATAAIAPVLKAALPELANSEPQLETAE